MFNLFSRKPRKPAHPMGSREANDEVRAVLAGFGDDGSHVRHVLHYAYPDAGTDLSGRVDMINNLKARGLEVSDAAAKDGLVMEQYRPVAGDDFDHFTDELSVYFSSRGWEYDGWECAVETVEEIAHAAE